MKSRSNNMQETFFPSHRIIAFKKSEYAQEHLSCWTSVIQKILEGEVLTERERDQIEVIAVRGLPLQEHIVELPNDAVVRMANQEQNEEDKRLYAVNHEVTWSVDDIESNYKDENSISVLLYFVVRVSFENVDEVDLSALNGLFLVWQKYCGTGKTPAETTPDSDAHRSVHLSELKQINTAIYSFNPTDNARLSTYMNFAMEWYAGSAYRESVYIYAPFNSVYAAKRIQSRRVPIKLTTLRKIDKVFPFIPVDYNSFSYLNRKVKTYFNSYEDIESTINNADAKGDEWIIKRLLARTAHHIFSGTDLDDYRKKQVFQKAKELTALQFVITTLFQRAGGINEINELLLIIEQAQIQGNAIRQLIENICYHSSEKKGLLSIRLLRVGNVKNVKTNQRDREDLKRRYPEKYLLGQNGEFRYENYYEVIVEDISSTGILSTFNNELKNAMESLPADSPPQASKSLSRQAASELSVKKFCDRNKELSEKGTFFNEYYTLFKVAFHQGLTIFKYDATASDGYFDIQSWSCNDEKNMETQERSVYASHGIETITSSGLCGTHIRALYPIRRASEQLVPHSQMVNIKANSPVNFSDPAMIPIECDKKDLATSTQEQKDKSGAELYASIKRKLGEKIKSDKKNIIIDIWVDDIADDMAREALLKHMGKVLIKEEFLQFVKIDQRAFSKDYSVAIRLSKNEDVIACIDALKLPYFISDSVIPIEIYIYDKEGFNQLHWKGLTLHEVLAMDKARTFSFGTDSVLTKYMGELDKDMTEPEEPQDLSLIPFPLLLRIEEGNDMTLFEKTVDLLLYREMMDEGVQGYAIKNAHMRVGSKIHVTDFFQAEAIFQNNYFISGFANLIAERIKKGLKKDSEILLVGYGIYSELTIYTLREYLSKNYAHINYVIYNPAEIQTEGKQAEDRFYPNPRKILHDPSQSEKIIYVYQIVGVSTTLSTFTKVYESLYKSLKGEEHIALRLMKNFAPIIVRDDSLRNGSAVTKQERLHFSCDSSSSRVLYTKADEGGTLELPDKTGMVDRKENEPYYYVDYFCAVETEWHNPEDCRYCYPDELTEEKPLVETNKTSVIPALQIGKNTMTGKTAKQLVSRKSKPGKYDEDRILRFFFDYGTEGIPQMNAASIIAVRNSSIIYRHITRGKNHFQYYINSKEVFERAMQGRGKYGLRKWFDEVKGNVRPANDQNNCHIIISPMHTSNVGFLSAVNKYVFENTAIIMHTEIEKDFNDSFQLKYQFVINQINHIIESDNMSDEDNGHSDDYSFNFYFVDDSINSGGTFARSKHLVNSLVNKTKYPEYVGRLNGKSARITIKVFKKIILLYDRLSTSSRRDFAEEGENDFKSFVNIPISSIRSHKDACILCKNVNDALELFHSSSLNRIATLWYERAIRKFQYDIDRDDIDRLIAEENDPEKSFYRFMVAFRANSILYECNDTNQARNVILELIQEAINHGLDSVNNSVTAFLWIESYLRVLTRPFMSFRKSTREAIFSILLEMIEEIGHADERKESAVLSPCQLCISICRNAKKTKELKNLILKRLSKMGSNYLMRISAFETLRPHYDTSENREMYIMGVKHVIEFSGDETKSLWLEKTLINHCEQHRKSHGEKGESPTRKYAYTNQEYKHGDTSSCFNFDLGLYIENTRIIKDAIYELRRRKHEGVVAWKKDLNIYYLQYYRKLLEENGVVDETRIEKINHNAVSILERLSERKKTDEDENVIVYYEKLCARIKDMIGADEVHLLGNHSPGKWTESYLIASSGKVISAEMLDNHRGEMMYLDTFRIDMRDDAQSNVREIYCKFGGKNNDAEDKARNRVEERMQKKDLMPRINDEVILRVVFDATKITSGKTVGGYPIELVFGLRMILLFRDMIMRRLEDDFHNTLLQSLRIYDDLSMHLGKIRATDHLDITARSSNYQCMVRNAKGHDFRYDYLKLQISQFIGRINIKLIQSKVMKELEKKLGYPQSQYAGIDKTTTKGSPFLDYELIQAIDVLTEKKVCFHFPEMKKSGGSIEDVLSNPSYNYRAFTETGDIPNEMDLSFLVLSALDSAISHSPSDEEKAKKAIEVSIRPNSKFNCSELIIANRFMLSQENIQDEERYVYESINRKKEGVSLAVTFEYINELYKPKNKDEFLPKEYVWLCSRGQEYWFSICLPLLSAQPRKGNADL